MLLFVSFISFLISSCATSENEQGFKVVLEKFYDCEGKKYPEVVYKDVEFTQYNRTTGVMNAMLHVNEEISEKLHMVVDISRCDSKQQIDSCQHFASQNFTEICANMDNPSLPYKRYTESIVDYDRKCPWKTGVYNVSEYAMSLKDLENMPSITGYFILTVKTFDGDKQIGCNVCEMSIVRKRRKSQ